MFIKSYQTIDFGGIGPFISIWVMNFFLLFSILTHLKLWYKDRMDAKDEVCHQKR
jgi:hypothetical protein